MIRRYNDSDYGQMKIWYVDRALTPPPRDMLPESGFIQEGVAAAFIYVTDSKLCILDLFITNAKAPVTERKKALDLIVLELEREARLWNCKYIMATSSIKATQELSLAHGYQYTGIVDCYFKGEI